MTQTSSVTAQNQTLLLNSWETSGYEQLSQARLYDSKHRQVVNVGESLPQNLTLSAAIGIFLSTLAGQSKQTHKTYRVGCRRLMWFVYSTDRGLPHELLVSEMSPGVLEDFYLWLVDNYGKQNRATVGAYMAATRNLFDYLSSRELTPGGAQYSKMVARLGKMQGRASYKTPNTLRIKGRQAQIEQVAHLAVASLTASEVVLSSGASSSEPDSPVAPDYSSADSAQVETKVTREDQPLPPKLSTRTAHSPAEIERRRLEELRDQALILTLFTTGMRREEVTRLDRTELANLVAEFYSYVKSIKPENDLEQSQRRVYELIITGKGQKERVVYFDEITLVKIEQYLKLRGQDVYRPLFLQHHRGRNKVKPGPGGENYRVGDRTVWVAVKKYAARLGLQLKPHDFRHNLASTLLNAGAQLSEVQDILGHASPTTTKQIYAHYDKGHLKDAFARFGKSATETS